MTKEINFKSTDIVVYNGLLGTYDIIEEFVKIENKENIRLANESELRRYYNRPEGNLRTDKK